MAEIEVRTPEDLDKVFTDLFSILYDMIYRMGKIEGELHKLNNPTIKIIPAWTPTPSWVGPTCGPGSVVPPKTSQLVWKDQAELDDLYKQLNIKLEDNEETKDNN